MSTVINGLLMPKFETFDYGRAVNQGINAAGGMLSNETRLLELAELKREQETAARTREFLQAHPEILMGQGGGSTIGSLGPAGAPGGMPAPAPPGTGPITQSPLSGGPAQQIPASPDASRYAGVSPQGGGPIPPNVMAQTMPQVTPPQSTIASLGPAGQPQMPAYQTRLMELARTSPEAALKVQQLMQGQQDLALQRDEQRLTMGTKVAEYVGRVAQGVTSPETLEQARQELARIHPQAAAQLPQVYSREAMVPFIKKAVSVKDNATLQLETWKNQIEMQKAGLQGEPAAMVSELRTMGVNPLQATTEQRVQAQKNIQQRELEQKEKEGLAGAQATAQANREARLEKTVSEVMGDRTTPLI